MKSETIIEFRPLTNWRGEYGFDWMRIYEGGASTLFSHPNIGLFTASWKFDFLTEEEMPYIDGARGAGSDYAYAPYVPNTDSVPHRNRTTPALGTGIILGGFTGFSTMMELSPAKAQEAIQKEYESFEIMRAGTLTYRLKTYFVPWLNLFPEPDAGGVPAPVLGAPSLNIVPPLRLCEAELQLVHDIKNALPQSIVIEFDKDFIEVDGDSSGRYTLPSVPSALTHPGYLNNVMQLMNNVRIKCIKEIDDLSGSKITVYAVDQTTNPGEKGTLAGKLIVCPNSRKTYQKEIKIILVRVRTNIDPTVGPVIGTFIVSEVRQLFSTLHQALLHPNVVNLDETGNDYVLDLRRVPEFHNPALYSTHDHTQGDIWVSGNTGPFGFPPAGSTPGQFVEFAPPTTQEPAEWVIGGYGDLHGFLVEKFNKNRIANGQPPITDRYFVFSFGNKGRLFSGRASGRDVNVELYIPPGHPMNPTVDFSHAKVWARRAHWKPSTIITGRRNNSTMGHEMLHALTLRHTHRDWNTPPPSPPSYNTHAPAEYSYLEPHMSMSAGCRYLFPYETTTNIMSYNSLRAFTTWRWQWEIMRNNVGIAPHHWTIGKEDY